MWWKHRLKSRPPVSAKERAELRRLSRYVKKKDIQCRSKHVAACVKGGNILSIGVNKNTMPGREWIDNIPCSEHAEIAALRQIKDTKGVKLYVIRVRSDGSSGLSHPCPSCSAYIEEMGIKKVVYSTEDTFDTVAA